MFRFLLLGAVAGGMALTLDSPSASAGNATLRKGAESVSIACRNSGCRVTIFKPGAAPRTRTSAGGTPNFRKLVARYRSRGFR
ncbi:MAG: hypothetical protein AAFR01_08935 [Pseudomonadota bacterium]